MTEMPSYLMGNPSFEPYKPQKRYPKKGVSSLSIVFSILTYILIFYVFNVSPSSVFNNTKILFFISNTLVLIIASDYGAFTDKERHDDDLYNEYMKAKRPHVFVPVYQENPRRRKNEGYGMISGEELKNRLEEVTIKDIVCVPSHDEVPEKILRVVSENIPDNVIIADPEPSIDQNVRRSRAGEEACDARNRASPKPYRRCKSEKVRTRHERNRDVRDWKGYDRSESERSKWMIVHEESKKEKTVMDQKWENVREESEEFSKMSNEELNRRVEEFIQRFNKQMKLQTLN